MKEKKAHGVQLLIRAVVRDPDGKVISDTGRKPAKSFLIQFLEFVSGLFYYTSTLNATAVDGTEDPIYIPANDGDTHFRVDGGVHVGTHGIVVGTGETAPTNTDYKLETKIAEGTGAGQLTHNATTVETTEVVGANVDLLVVRAFTNGSGSTITVEEAGLYTYSAGSYHCIIRDILAGGVDVPDKCSLTIIYTLRTTV